MCTRSTPRLPDSYGQSGISAQASFRYDWRLPVWSGWQQMQFGYDFKRSNNDLEFGGFQVFNSNMHIHQFVFTYDMNKTDNVGQSRTNVTAVLSPGISTPITRTMPSKARGTARRRATRICNCRDSAISRSAAALPHGAARCSSGRRTRSCRARNWGCAATAAWRLRTYVVQGDRGWNLQTELRTPASNIGTSDIAIQSFLFVDTGHVWNKIDQPAEPNNGSLIGLGAAFRFQVSRFVSVRGTYGYRLRAATPGASKAPVGMLYIVAGS